MKMIVNHLSCYWPDFVQTLKVGSWDHLQQMLNVMVTFVHVTFVLITFVHIGNISVLTDPNLTFFGPNFWGHFFLSKIHLDLEWFWTKVFRLKNLFDQKSLVNNIFWTNLNKEFFGIKKFLGPNLLWIINFHGPKFFLEIFFLDQQFYST